MHRAIIRINASGGLGTGVIEWELKKSTTYNSKPLFDKLLIINGFTNNSSEFSQFMIPVASLISYN